MADSITIIELGTIYYLDSSADVAGAVAAAKSAARAVMAAQEQVAAAKNAALQQQSIASTKEAAAAHAAHKRFDLPINQIKHCSVLFHCFSVIGKRVGHLSEFLLIKRKFSKSYSKLIFRLSV